MMPSRMTLDASMAPLRRARMPRRLDGPAAAPPLRPAARAACQRCGAEARVRVLEDYFERKPVLRRLCVACSDRIHERAIPAPAGPWLGRLRAAAARLLVAGLAGTAAAFGA